MSLATFQILMTLKLLLNLRANLIAINELSSLNFCTRALNVKPKKLILGIKLLQNLPNGTKMLQKLPNGKKILQIYGMECKHRGMSSLLHPSPANSKKVAAVSNLPTKRDSISWSILSAGAGASFISVKII